MVSDLDSLLNDDEEQKKREERRRSPQLKEKRPGQSNPKTSMASTSRTGIEIRKFDDKNFALWKEMMQDVLIIRRKLK